MKVELLDTMGSDLSVVNAARVSFDKESEWEWSHVNLEDDDGTPFPGITLPVLSKRDEGLIDYLARHNHWSPFAHTSLQFRVKAPIFVARQLGKHQVGLVWNEVSRRYVDTPPEFYEPEAWRKRADDKKQGSSDEEVETIRFLSVYETECRSIVDSFNDVALKLYNSMIDAGVCPEQARMVLPQSMYTEWIWTGSLYAFARVVSLRDKPDAQKETQEIARMIAEHCAKAFPVSWGALTAKE